MPDSDPILRGLTPPQLAAVTHLDGPMLVVAGAGSGKTRVVTHRIAWLISQGVWPGQILAMTFTNKAAQEMRNRVEGLVGGAPNWMGTFHAICAKLLRQHLDEFPGDSRNSKFTICDDDDQRKLIRACLKELAFDEKTDKLTPNMLLGCISNAKSAFIDPDSYTSSSPAAAQVRQVYALYEKKLRASNAFDFDDLLVVTVQMLRETPYIRDLCLGRFRYLLVDEYQDTNHVQYLLLRLLAGPEHNVHVTGDPDQSIYSWRGALYRNIMEFPKDFPGAKIVRLEQNYRSSGNILAVANSLIENNRNRIEKELFTDRGAGALVTIGRFYADRDEADWVAKKIDELRLQGFSLRDNAVFYRTNAQSRTVEEAMIRHHLPYQIIGGIRFYERREIKDFIAILRLLVNPGDDLALQRILDSRPFGIGGTTLAKLRTLAAEQGTVAATLVRSPEFATLWPKAPASVRKFAAWLDELHAIPSDDLDERITEALRRSGLIEHYQALLKKEMSAGRRSAEEPNAEERIDNLNAFLERAEEFVKDHAEATLEAFLEEIALNSAVDDMQNGQDQDRVAMMTLHCSKGLEYPCVFITGLEQGLLPHINAWADGASDVDEERRLFYVGITRAEQHLFITHAESRYQWGNRISAMPSAFLRELPQKNLTMVGGSPLATVRQNQVKAPFTATQWLERQQSKPQSPKNPNDIDGQHYDYDDF